MCQIVVNNNHLKFLSSMSLINAIYRTKGLLSRTIA
nr:MAG TPA: hypothetical protein [Caudoviricetes sp.]